MYKDIVVICLLQLTALLIIITGVVVVVNAQPQLSFYESSSANGYDPNTPTPLQQTLFVSVVDKSWTIDGTSTITRLSNDGVVTTRTLLSSQPPNYLYRLQYSFYCDAASYPTTNVISFTFTNPLGQSATLPWTLVCYATNGTIMMSGGNYKWDQASASQVVTLQVNPRPARNQGLLISGFKVSNVGLNTYRVVYGVGASFSFAASIQIKSASGTIGSVFQPGFVTPPVSAVQNANTYVHSLVSIQNLNSFIGFFCPEEGMDRPASRLIPLSGNLTSGSYDIVSTLSYFSILKGRTMKLVTIGSAFDNLSTFTCGLNLMRITATSPPSFVSFAAENFQPLSIVTNGVFALSIGRFTLTLPLTVYGTPQYKNLYLRGGNSASTLPNIIPTSVTDVNPPVVNSVDFSQIGNPVESYLVNMNITDDFSGFMYAAYCGYNVTSANLYQGTLNNGLYQVEISVSGLVCDGTLTVFDRAFNSNNMTSLAFNDIIKMGTAVEPVPTPICKSMQHIQYIPFSFEPNNVDVSMGDVNITLYFNSNDVDRCARPMIYIGRTYRPIDIRTLPSFVGAFDPVAKMFKIPITLKQKQFTGSLYYSLVSYPSNIDPFSGTQEYIVPSSNLTLNVYSSDADQQGPMVLNTTYTLVYGQYVQWTVAIEDKTGFNWGRAIITSNLTAVPYSFVFNRDSMVSGDKYTGIYHIIIPYTQCLNQILSLDLGLCDDLGNCGSSNAPRTLVPQGMVLQESLLSPFASDPSTGRFMPMTCQIKPPLTTPVIKSITIGSVIVDVGSSNRKVSIEVAAQSDAGMFQELYRPTVVLIYNLQVIKFETQVLRSSDTTTFFGCIADIPFGFGTESTILLSVYGLVDNYFNTASYSSYDLKTAHLPYYIKTTFTLNTPILESSTPLSSLGGVITVRGKNLPDLTSNQYLVSIDGVEPFVQLSTLFKFRNIFSINAPGYSSSLRIKVVVNDVQSNTLVAKTSLGLNVPRYYQTAIIDPGSVALVLVVSIITILVLRKKYRYKIKIWWNREKTVGSKLENIK
eukprot:gene9180-10771_t